MRFITTAFLIGLMIAAPSMSFGALPPTSVQGQSGTKSTAFDFQAPYNQYTKTGSTKALIETDSSNVLKNPRFEATTYSSNWTASAGTLAAAASTNIFYSKGATWDSNGAAQTFTSDAITIPEGFKGNNCEASMYIKVPSGTATYLFQAHDGTNPLGSATVVNSTLFTKNTVTFPCPTSGTFAIRILSVAADEPLIALDEAYLGLARNVGSGPIVTEWTSFTPTGGWTGGSVTYTGRWRQVGNNMQVNARVATSGAPTGTNLTINLPSVCTIDTTKMASPSSLGNTLFGSASIVDTGTRIYDARVVYNNTTSVAVYAVGQAVTNIDFTGFVTPTVPMTFASGDTVDVWFDVPCVGWAASTVVMPDAQGWYVSALVGGTNPSLGVANVSSYTEIISAGLTMTPQSGSAPAGIMCSSTNAAASPSSSATTCSAGSESMGLNVVIPRSGAYEVCADFSHYMEADQAEGVNAVFQIVQTPTNAQTITAEGGSRKSGRNAPLAIASGTAQAINLPYTVCGIFQLSAGTNGFRLMYEQLVTGTPNGSEVLTDELASVGQRNARFTIKPVSQQQQAILANSVSSANTNGVIYNSAQVGSTGTVSKETGDWISGNCVVASAVATCTLVAGAFTTDPACVTTNFGETTNFNSTVTSASTSTVVVRTFDTANAASASAFAIHCSSPR